MIKKKSFLGNSTVCVSNIKWEYLWILDLILKALCIKSNIVDEWSCNRVGMSPGNYKSSRQSNVLCECENNKTYEALSVLLNQISHIS